MDIRIFQMNVKAGDPEANFRNIKDFIDSNMGADLLILPEMCVGGYLVGDEWNRQDFAEWVASFNDKIRELSYPLGVNENDTKAVTIVWGNIAIDHNKKNEDGRVRKYNAVWAAHNGEYLTRKLWGKDLPAYQAKTLMPNYRFFDDKRYFTSFTQYLHETYPEVAKRDHDDINESAYVPFDVWSYKEKASFRVGLQVCEDMWHSDYDLNPTKGYAASDADFIVNVSASPWTWGKEKARANVVSNLADSILQDGLEMPPIYYANIVGAQNNGKNVITFDGRSSVYNSEGRLIQECNRLFEQHVMKTEFPVPTDLPMPDRALDSDLVKYKEKIEAITAGLRHIALRPDQKWVIGLSGGIDSAVSACLLVKTFGKDNVMAVNMPSKYNSKATKSAAEKLAKNLGISYVVVPIEKAIMAKRKAIYNGVLGYKPRFESDSIYEENEQARMRGMILADIAAANGAFFINNGNKAETAAGYATLYGDVAGAISPLADLTKEEVYGMARFLNEYGFEYHLGCGEKYEIKVIPEEIILDKDFSHDGEKIKPSAELKHDQVDPLKFGFMCKLLENGVMDYKKVGMETVLQSWLDRTIIEDFKLDKDLFYKYNLHEAKVFVEEIEFVFSKLKGSTFKRVQTPPVVITSKSSFGYDYRESILPHKTSEKSRALVMKILAQKYY